jgi:DNA primase
LINLLDLAEHDTQLKKAASTGGGEYSGSCPFCGGKDRFRVQPNGSKKEGGRWYCRGCGEGRWHDVFDYVMRRDGLNFPQAKKLIEGDNQTWKPITRNPVKQKAIELDYDYDTWQSRAAEYIQYCENNLLDPIGDETSDWLHRRGLSEAVIMRANLGYNPKDIYDAPERWGYPENHDRIFLSHGLIIPNIDTAGIHAIKVRRHDVQGKYKYIVVKGSGIWIYGAWTCQDASTAFLFESELDALLALSTGYGLGYLALPAGQNIHKHYDYIFDDLEHVIVMPDDDEPGMAHAEKMSKINEFYIGLIPSKGKDITELYQCSGDDGISNVIDLLYDSAGIVPGEFISGS